MAFRHEHGRRYVLDSVYLLPNDEEELQRLDLQHKQWMLTLDGSLHLAPLPTFLPDDYHVLDLGCGTGVWTIAFARQHPQSNVLGLDLASVQRDNVPVNCRFAIANIEHRWDVQVPYDFIHTRFLIMGIKDWPQIFRQSYEHLKPGGWVEFQEANVVYPTAPQSPKPNPEMTSLVLEIKEIASRMGVDIEQASEWTQAIKDAGFINHRIMKIRWPLGAWSSDPKEKKIGKLNGQNIMNVLEGVCLAYLVSEENPEKEVRKRIEKVKAEIDDEDVWLYQDLYIHVAQKPE